MLSSRPLTRAFPTRGLPTRALIVGALLLTTAIAAPATAADFNLDSSHSSVLFRIKHAGASYFWGAFHKVTGTAQFNPKKPTAMKLNVNVATKSVFTASKKRDDHLKGPDFFDAKRFPTMSFKSTKVKKTRNGLAITGVMTLHGVSKTVTAQAEYVGMGKGPYGNIRAGWEARLTINRADFGMRYMLGGLSNAVQLVVALEGIQVKPKKK